MNTFLLLINKIRDTLALVNILAGAEMLYLIKSSLTVYLYFDS